MPQMAPINWLSLFIIFSITFILFNMMNYYLVIPKSPKSMIYKKSDNQHFTWKW
uniref:ATP synthase F0 subunit 8 n=1 Tax=Rhagoletis cerasi TaxID=43399 RepID=UPI001F141200|nr:ATP synthase F0 subunit 8 [Rhagoletis cerasi]UMI33247.1 ATP synthase F0 subunit 8 [Rhagoletis cerasi]UMI33260.1 ATP synthase F0 subunit 8 [Rhagoletis cerasi]UMI33273.1 ATP synthase F0 subunit 8 [Rhagoletis cerasi]WCB98180.1 ATP synthase F0 subunit 8 [Rhagoletis cerasi]WCB98193.1 ATP synthase F0 subunit 8 [Rhagoletis cerasi]